MEVVLTLRARVWFEAWLLLWGLVLNLYNCFHSLSGRDNDWLLIVYLGVICGILSLIGGILG